MIIKKILLLLAMAFTFMLFTACASKNSETIPIIEDVEQFSNISIEELKNIMGEPELEETWTHSTMKGNFDFITFSYSKNSSYYEFIIADNSVVRLTIYSNNYWTNAGDRFSIINQKSDIYKSFNISLGNNVKEAADTGYAYRLSQVNDKIDMFDIQDIDSNTYGFVKITYNSNYFD